MQKRCIASLLLIPLAVWANEPSPKKTAQPPVKHAHKRALTHAKAAPVLPAPAVTEVVPDEHKLAVAEKVHTGRMACELGNHVSVTPDPQSTGGFVVQMKQHSYHMTPVVSSTGAIRLEDTQAGAMWLQLANKSMLMNTKLGQRLADECQSPAQLAVAEAMKLAPPINLLDGGRDVAKN